MTEALHRLAAGSHHAPHDLLGPHPDGDGWVVRALFPMAQQVTLLLDTDQTRPLDHVAAGVFAVRLPTEPGRYRFLVDYGSGATEVDDPYRFWPSLGEVDRHLISEGRHEQLWQALGARPVEIDGVAGTAFAVWAPNARGVRLVGDVNGWDGRHPMRSLGASGVWELFVPGAEVGGRYKFEVLGADGSRQQHADPLARRAEPPPATASIIDGGCGHEWGDSAWLAAREAGDAHTGPMSVYEVHLGSWRPGLDYRQAAEELVSYVTDCGFTHVELMPVMEHPFGGSWGYQVTGYFAPTARFGRPDDLRYLIDRLHRAGIGVILDWVPAHFPRDEWALARFDGTPLYEHADPQRGQHPQWGTLIFDFGRPEVRNFLVASALYWLTEFHADGLRVDAVASMLYLDYGREDGDWTPNAVGGNENLDAVRFLAELTATCYRHHPGIVMIAEESTAWPGVTARTEAEGLGFGLKWNLGWMNDTLRYLAREPIHRRFHHDELTFGLMYAFSEQFLLPLSHDEVVHGKGSLLSRIPGDRWQQLATLRAYLAFTWAHPGKQLLFMGQEFGQPGEWSEQNGLDWAAAAAPEHAGVRRCVADLNRCYRERPALWRLDHEPAGFTWCDADDAAGNLLAWLRHDGAGGVVAAVVNFSPVPQEAYRLGLPQAGPWRELINTDAEEYGGSGVGNQGRVVAEPVPHQGQPASAVLRVPPLGAVLLEPGD